MVNRTVWSAVLVGAGDDTVPRPPIGTRDLSEHLLVTIFGHQVAGRIAWPSSSVRDWRRADPQASLTADAAPPLHRLPSPHRHNRDRNRAALASAVW